MLNRPLVSAAVFFTATAALLPACTSTSQTDRTTQPDQYQAQLRQHGSLTHNQVTHLYTSPDGRKTLTELAEKYDNLHYDGNDRFTQIVKTYSFAAGDFVPTLELHSGWMHPKYSYTRSVLLFETSFDDQFAIDFHENSVFLNIEPEEGEHRMYTIGWEQDKMPQHGFIKHESEKVVLND